MPIYILQCHKCGKKIEEFFKNFESSKGLRCKGCQGPMEHKISLSTFVLTGKDWPSKEYRNNNLKK
jgi:putative FmdB family regulatory protein